MMTRCGASATACLHPLAMNNFPLSRLPSTHPTAHTHPTSHDPSEGAERDAAHRASPCDAAEGDARVGDGTTAAAALAARRVHSHHQLMRTRTATGMRAA